ncbi:MAG: PilN domain-containing protein [Nitrospira sp.]|nr:PilN domain-containing protein [Nitrospira sp.]MBH0180627.1 PilN domain-containing protein [Nitrospira sp.]
MGTLKIVIDHLADLVRHASLLGKNPACFHINVSTRYRPAVAPLRTLLVAICGILSLWIFWSLGQAALGYREVRTIEAELDRVRQLDVQLVTEAREEGLDLSEGALQGLSAEVDLANQLLEKRTFSWTKFLAGLEQVIPARLALSSVQFDAGGAVVHLTGTAMSLEDITAFTVGLQDHPMFKDPVLAQHRAGANGLVEFNVTLRYRQTGA